MRRVKLSEIAELTGGSTPKTKVDEYWDGDIVWLSPTDLPEIGEIVSINDSSRKITEEGLNSCSAKLLPTGTVIFSSRASIGKIGINEIPVATNQGFINFICNGELYNRYLAYVLKYYTEDIVQLSNSTTFKEVSKRAIKDFKIPLPTLSEQKAIVAKLDRAQRLIDIDRQMLAKYDELIQSVFLEMFGDPVRNEKVWEVKKLGEICNKITDGTHHSPSTYDEGIPYVTAKHVDPFKVDFYEKPSYVKEEDHRKIYSRCDPEKGDVLLIKDGATTGKAAINPYDFEFSMLSSLALLKLDTNQITGKYLVNVLNDDRYKDFIRQKYMSGVAIKRYTLKKINQFELPVPDIRLQQKFDKFSKKVRTEKELVRSSAKKSEELFSSLVQDLFG